MGDYCMRTITTPQGNLICYENSHVEYWTINYYGNNRWYACYSHFLEDMDAAQLPAWIRVA